jgi:carboxyl-terminal processing protease
MAVAAVAGPAAGQNPEETWSAGFRRLEEELKNHYAFTAWKGIDWGARHAELASTVALAESTGDTAVYYLTLRHFIHAIPDRHVKVRGEPANLRFGMVGGGVGLTTATTDDGTLLVTRVLPGGPAERAGIRPGDEVIEIGGLPASQAAAMVDPVWSRGLAATREGQELERLRWLGRGPVGSRVPWTVNSQGGPTRDAVLQAEPDGWWSADVQDFYTTNEEREQPVEWRRMVEGPGYLKITTLAHPDPAVAGRIDDNVAAAVASFVETGVEDLILDLRHNAGGLDELAAELAGHFLKQDQLYYQGAYYEGAAGTLRRFEDPEYRIPIVPRRPYFPGRVVVMLSPGTVSAGEGLAEAVLRRPDAVAISFRGSNGSYGITGGKVTLPAGFVVVYPEAASLDEEDHVLLDSDIHGRGGVQPTVRVPLTRAAVLARARGEDPEMDFVLAWLGAHAR